jgi:hypothetical protein
MNRTLAKHGHALRSRISAERAHLQRPSDQTATVLQEKLTVLAMENKQLKHTATTAESGSENIRKQNDDLSLRFQAAEMRLMDLVNDVECEKQLLTSETKPELFAGWTHRACNEQTSRNSEA